MLNSTRFIGILYFAVACMFEVQSKISKQKQKKIFFFQLESRIELGHLVRTFQLPPDRRKRGNIKILEVMDVLLVP